MKRFGVTAGALTLVAALAWAPSAWTEVSKGDFKKRCEEYGGTYSEGMGRYSCCFADYCVDCWLPYQTGGSTTCYKRCTTPKCKNSGQAVPPDELDPRRHLPSPPATQPTDGDSSNASPPKAAGPVKAVPVQPKLKVLSHRIVKGDLETMLAFSKDGDGFGRIRTKAEPQGTADEVAVRGRSGTATVHVRGVCAGKPEGTLHLAHEMIVRVTLPGGGWNLSVGSVEQALPFAELCKPRVPAPKSEGGQEKAR